MDDIGHLAAAGRVVRDDAEVVDGATWQVVVHQTDGTVGTWRSATAASFTRRLEVNHVLQYNIASRTAKLHLFVSCIIIIIIIVQYFLD